MTEKPANLRLFVSVDVSAPVREQLLRVQKELREAAGDAIRWTPPEQMHLTLRFFGDIPASALGEIESTLRRACQRHPPFTLRAVGIGAFPDLRHPRVIWAGVTEEAAALQALQKDILAATSGWGQVDSREFSPHLTLGRVREPQRTTRGRGRPRSILSLGGVRDSGKLGDLAGRLSALAERDFGNWRVNGVRLMQSELASGGARHTELAAIELKPQPA